jgi:anti-anti-sigma factor
VSTVAHSFRIQESDPRAGLHVISVEGELDLAVAGELQAAIDRAAGAERVIVDLEPCEFIDSTGIAVLIRGREALIAAGGSLAICSPNRQVLRVLEVTGLTALEGFLVSPPPTPVRPFSGASPPSSSPG